MIILPAIDIKDGNCVRLQKGVYSTAQQVADSPYETAKGFADAGVAHVLAVSGLHMMIVFAFLLRGLRRLLPTSMQVPPVPVDDFVAVILGTRFLAREAQEERGTKL